MFSLLKKKTKQKSTIIQRDSLHFYEWKTIFENKFFLKKLYYIVYKISYVARLYIYVYDIRIRAEAKPFCIYKSSSSLTSPLSSSMYASAKKRPP